MFNEVMFNEMRVVPVKTMNTLTEENMVRAMTDHENLTSLGFCMKPKDIVKLAQSDISIYDIVKGYVDKVEADPMYPDFPTQVMEMDEAKFRFQQIVHYFSTYGMEDLFGVEVAKGWLPKEPKTEKTKEQNIVLPTRTISLIDEADKYEFVLKKLLTKRERLTIPEKTLVSEAARNVSPKTVRTIPVRFKENLMDLFVLFFDKREDEVLYCTCQHTGDILTCIRYLLTRHRYKLSTSERKRLVRLIERYPVEDFKSNLILSNKKAKNSFIVLDYLSYNKFSRNPEHKKAVKAFRNGELRSWESGLKKILFSKEENVLPYIAKRPGMLVRMVAWLLRLGYPEADIKAALVENAESLSIQTLVTVLNRFSSEEFEGREERAGVLRVIATALGARMTHLDTPLKGKKVYVEEGMYDFSLSRIEANEKSEEGGYIRSGLTFRIPEAVKTMRFFVYWNDEDRVDVDLHSYAKTTDGEDIHVGWNGDYNRYGITTSGDITHSDAAEYIDINLEDTEVAVCKTQIHIYSGKDSFRNLETCFTGMMGVDSMDADVELYSAANCFFYHNLNGPDRKLDYCVIEPGQRRMQIVAKPGDTDDSRVSDRIEKGFSVSQYLELLFAGQNATPVAKKEEADMVIRLDKGADVSLIDENYFMDA